MQKKQLDTQQLLIIYDHYMQIETETLGHLFRYLPQLQCSIFFRRFSMPLVTHFNDLLGFVLIELFQYLSSVDILTSVIDYNSYIQQLVHEQGSFRRLNLSTASLDKFDTFLNHLSLTPIEIFVFLMWMHHLFSFLTFLTYQI